jgi:ribokinase
VTMGARGALLATPASIRRIEPVRVAAVDTTGAGDAFVGAFARYSVEGDLEGALRMAGRYAADSVTRRGTQKAFSPLDAFEAFCARLDAAGP